MCLTCYPPKEDLFKHHAMKIKLGGSEFKLGGSEKIFGGSENKIEASAWGHKGFGQ